MNRGENFLVRAFDEDVLKVILNIESGKPEPVFDLKFKEVSWAEELTYLTLEYIGEIQCGFVAGVDAELNTYGKMMAQKLKLAYYPVDELPVDLEAQSG